MEVGLSVEGGGDAGVEADPVAAGLGLGRSQVEVVVVDGGQGPADEQGAVHEVDVGPVQAEDFAAAKSGADHDLVQVGERVGVGCGVVAQERGCLGGTPAQPLGGGRARDDRVQRGVVDHLP